MSNFSSQENGEYVWTTTESISQIDSARPHFSLSAETSRSWSVNGRDDHREIHLIDSSTEEDSLPKWPDSRRTVSTKFAPLRNNKLAIYIAAKEPTDMQVFEFEGDTWPLDQRIYEYALTDINKLQRSLYNDGYAVFAVAQRPPDAIRFRSKMGGDSILLNAHERAMDEISAEYSSIIRAHCARVSKFPEVRRATTDIYTVWELCRVLFMGSERKSARLGSALVGWVNECFPIKEFSKMDITRLRESPRPLEEPQLWACVQKLIVRSNSLVNKVLESVIRSSEISAERQAVEQLYGYLNTKPRIEQYYGREFDYRLGQWQNTCREFANSLELSDENTQDSIITIVNILCADMQTVFQHCYSWQEALTAWIAHGHPNVSHADIRELLEAVLPNFPLQEDNYVELALKAFLRVEIEEGLRICENIDIWLAAHLADMFQKLKFVDAPTINGGFLSINNTQPQCSLREYYLLSYAELLVTSTSLWQVGFEYFRHCPLFGRSYMQQLIARMPTDSEWKTQKILNICKVNELHEEARIICKQASIWKKKRYASAILYYTKAGDTPRLTKIAHNFLDEYIETGELTYINVIDSVSLCEKPDESINFLVQYRNFHELLKTRQYRPAGQALVDMLKSHIAPRRFWPILLINSLPLLRQGENQGEEVVLNVEENSEVLRILQEVTSHHREEFLACIEKVKRWYKGDRGYDEIDDNLTVVRLALAKNLSRTIWH
ncbi:10465_t:CDS:10 [Paraglomus brasilianum]|uniref:Nuclear pore complex protein Nup85 n=1 Tax=Paraglomus brasilianum TaxID=144538 RepID=A0A9N9ACX7_9GLOM|nr:10465_t:CDS:10 [Paraglomus brasilianum]